MYTQFLQYVWRHHNCEYEESFYKRFDARDSTLSENIVIYCNIHDNLVQTNFAFI